MCVLGFLNIDSLRNSDYSHFSQSSQSRRQESVYCQGKVGVYSTLKHFITKLMDQGLRVGVGHVGQNGISFAGILAPPPRSQATSVRPSYQAPLAD